MQIRNLCFKINRSYQAWSCFPWGEYLVLIDLLTALSVCFYIVFDGCLPLHVFSALYDFFTHFLFFMSACSSQHHDTHWPCTHFNINLFPRPFSHFFHSRTNKNTLLHTLSSVTHLFSVHSCGCGSFFFFCPWRHHWWCHPPLRPIIQA